MKGISNGKKRCLGLIAGATLIALAVPEVQTLAWVAHGASFSGSSVDYRVNANFPDAPAGSMADQTAAIQRGADEWQINGKGSFGFNHAGSTAVASVGADGVNSVFYGGGDGNGALAVATWFTSGSTTVQFDIEFYDRDGGDDFVWSINPGPSEFDIRSVATHEFGHVLGLGHSSEGNAVMFATVNAGSTTNRTLHADDIAGYQSIYGSGMPVSPTVSSATAGDAWIQGGGTLTVSGGGFSSSGTSVTVGGLSASNVIVQDHGQLACTLPAHTAKGPHDVVVTTDGSSSGTLSDGFAYDTARIVGPVAFEQYTTIEMIVPADAGLSYFAATANGNTGVALNQWDPMDNRIFPLDDDILFVASVYHSDGIPEWRDLSGTLDMTGRATWGFWLPNWPMLQGVTIYTAAVSADANFPSGMKTITNDVAVTYP